MELVARCNHLRYSVAELEMLIRARALRPRHKRLSNAQAALECAVRISNPCYRPAEPEQERNREPSASCVANRLGALGHSLCPAAPGNGQHGTMVACTHVTRV